MSFEQIAALSGYNNPASGRQRATCSGSIIGEGGFKLEANGGTESYPVNDGWQGAWFGRTNCSFTGDLGSCETGNCLATDGWGHLQCSGVGSTAPASKGEMNMDLTSGIDYYDVSLVDGYNLPMQITPRDYNPAYVNADPADLFRCTSAGCLNSSALSSCPSDLTYLPNGNLVGCQDDCSLATIYHNVSPYYFTQSQVDAYCCPDTTYCSPANPCGPGSTCAAWIQNPSTCLNCNATNGGIYPNGYPAILTNSALYFHATFPNAYSFTYDDASASYTCNSTPSTGLRTKYDITFCAQSSAPVAGFTGTPTSGTAPLTVIFTDSSTNTPTSWLWNFGDSSSVNATQQNPVHTYASAGTYTVALTATNAAGSNTATRTNYITVTSPITTSGVGVFRQGVFYLRNSNSAGNADNVFSYGASNDEPIVGDWTGQGQDTVGIFRQGVFYLRNSNSAGNADNVFSYGVSTDTPIVGDWTGKGYDSIGVFRSGMFYLKDTNSAGNADNVFSYGAASGDIPVVWHHDGKDTVGIFRSGTFYLKDSNSAGNADNVFSYGAAGDTPVDGKWI
jgi:PKD repeat protein